MLTPRPTTPTQALDLAFRRQKPTRAQLDDFQLAKQTLLAAINPTESEEHLKKLLTDFLAHPGVLGPGYYLNVRKKRDLVIRTGPREGAPVGAIVEVKRAANPGEMVTPHDLNRKALHELLLYYLEDRRDGHADNLRRLVITNGYEWFVFDALDFDRLFWRDAGLKGDFLAWAGGKKAGKTTKYFYEEVAYPFLAGLEAELPFAYLDLRAEPATERDRITLAKLFQAPHLLKAPFAQDANTLNRAFYEELLYLIGLEEVPEKGRKLIKRVAPAEREHAGSLLRNTLDVLESEDRLANLPPAERAAYGPTPPDQLFGVALELCLTWINRLLFLKLLEGQLRRYHAGNPAALTEPYRFLTPELLPDFDTLNDLFFKVLNRPADQRTPAVRARYAHLPYLNSSLYETSELERRTITVRELDDHLTLPLHRKSVLPAQPLPPPTLAYLLRFLDAYDFASEGDEQVQETHKPLISAAVLGLIFEKLNGYQDGSFYTPGFITMYMARHTLRRAVVQHFNRRSGYQAPDVPALAEALEAKNRVADSAYFNTLTVLDPAVGSGHFLVSALNELLAIKAELGLLLDADGKRLRYRLTVARDELVVVHEDDDPHDPAALFQYRARLDAATGQRTVAPAPTALQRALFQEKRHLIEHALFGVDINPNSVRICRLRLWIELLKHAYYLPESGFAQLETLPNLDLNIKAGNSLLSRFDLGADLSDVFRQSKFTLATYRDAVHAYFNTRDRAAKQELQRFLGQIKEQFTQALHKRDPLREKLRRAAGERTVLETQGQLLPETPKQRETRDFEIRRLSLLIEQYEQEVERHEQGQLYRHAFEWRFEFPEVLDEKGRFRGFDVVIGNPPYLLVSDTIAKKQLHSKYKLASGKPDLFKFFIERSYQISAKNGQVALIVPSSLLSIPAAQPIRKFLLEEGGLSEIVSLYSSVFPDASVVSTVFFGENSTLSNTIRVIAQQDSQLADEFLKSAEPILTDAAVWLADGDYKFSVNEDDEQRRIMLKMEGQSTTLEEVAFYTLGMQVYHNTIYTKDEMALRPAHNTQKVTKNHYPEVGGRHIQKYAIALPNDQFVDYSAKAYNKPAWHFFSKERIVLREIPGKTLIASIVDTPAVFNKSTMTIINKNESFSIKYLLGVLNSTVLGIYANKSTEKGEQRLFPRISLTTLKQLPIPPATPAQQAEIAALVERVLAAKAAGEPTAPLEAAIDALVAARYGLTPAEVAQLG